jgi:hypothetical protein
MANGDTLELDVPELESTNQAVRRPVFLPDVEPQAEGRAVTQRPVFLPDVEPQASVSVPKRPIFLPDSQGTEYKPQPTPAAADIPLTTPARELSAEIANRFAEQTPAVPASQMGVAPRAYPRDILAARQQAEEFGADFARRAQRAGAVGAAQQRAAQYAETQPMPEPPHPDTVADIFTKSWQTLLASARESAAAQEKSAHELAAKAGPPPVTTESLAVQAERRARLLNPNFDRMSDIEQDAAVRAARATLEAEQARDVQEFKDYETKEAQKSAVQEEAHRKSIPTGFEETLPGKIARTVGGLWPYAPASVLGAAGVGTAAVQMGTSSWGQAKEEALAQLNQLHPEMDQKAKDAAADKVADIAFGTGLVSGLTLGVAGTRLPISNIVARTIAGIGLGGVVQGGVAGAQQLTTNLAIKEQINPDYNLLTGVPEAATGGAALGGVFGGLHALPPVPKTEYGPTGARIRGPQERTLEEGQRRIEEGPPPRVPVAEVPVAETPVTEQAVVEKPPVTEEKPLPLTVPEAEEVRPVADEQQLGTGAEKLYNNLNNELKGSRSVLAPPTETIEPSAQALGFFPRPPRLIPEALKRWFGATVKGGESFALDYPELHPVALALRREPSFRQSFGEQTKIFPLEQALRGIAPKERERVIKEYSDYFKAAQNKQPLPTVSPETIDLIQKTKESLVPAGQIAKALNVHVQQSDGTWRPIRLIGPDYFPRMISGDTRDIFNERNGARRAEFDAIVHNAIARGEVKTRDEFVDKFTQALGGDTTSNDHFSNIEKARELKLPLSFYDTSPEAVIRYLHRAGERLAQIAAYGQKTGARGKDLFDVAIEKVDTSSRSYRDRQMIINRLNQLRRDVYKENYKSNLQHLSSLGRSGATAAFLGNWGTSVYNLIGGTAHNLAFGGPANFTRAMLDMPRLGKLVTEARERNILRTNLLQVLHDYDLAGGTDWASKAMGWTVEKAMKWGGQNLTENINRTLGMQQAKYLLSDFSRWYGSRTKYNPRQRWVMEQINKLGIHDLNALAAEHGIGPLSDEFIRQYVMEIHSNYGPGQLPAHIYDSPAGKFFLQFGKWGANASRILTRYYLAPLARAIKTGRRDEIFYHGMRSISFILAGVGAGGLGQALMNWAKERDPRDPTMGEIADAMVRGDNGQAFQWALQRAYGALILSGFTGNFGNYYDLAKQLGGKDPAGRVKDPLHPPVFGLLSPIFNLVNGWIGEGRAIPSAKLINDFINSTLSAYRVGAPMALARIHDFNDATGIEIPGLTDLAKEEHARSSLAFIRSRVNLFEQENPEFKEKQLIRGTRAISMGGRTQYDPFHDRIQAGLLTARLSDVNSAMREWLNNFPAEQLPARLKGLRESILSSTPIKPGGSTSLDSAMQFLDWAKKSLPEGEARRIFAQVQTYAKTAMQTGVFEKNATIQGLAKVDYDRFNTYQAKSAKPADVRKAQAQLADLIRRGNVAKALEQATQ